jgi:ABC-type dipeptide/oligopeptide/nickel transport system permease component
MTRATMLEVLQQDYIKTAGAKGIGQRGILFAHALKNAAVPVVTVIGLGIAVLIGGAVVTESVFVIPGLGRLTVGSILRRDYPVIQGLVLLFSFAYVIVNLCIDLLGLLAIMGLIAVLAPYLVTVDPTPAWRTREPSALYWFGTDMFGRDVYSRVLYGARISLIFGFSVAFLASVIGLAIGLVSGFLRWADGAIVRVMDGLMSILPILLAIA